VNEPITHWKELCNLLKGQVGCAPEPTIVATRKQIVQLYSECVIKGVALPVPDFDDRVFDDMHELGPDIQIDVEAIRQAAMKAEAKRAYVRQYHRKRRRLEAEALRTLGLVKVIRKRVPEGGRGPNTCFCGCGLLTRSTFYRGHNSRWVAWMRRIERGEMLRGSLPPIILVNTKWRLCCKCSGFMPTTDENGFYAGKIGFDCLLTRQHVPDEQFPEPMSKRQFKIKVRHDPSLIPPSPAEARHTRRYDWQAVQAYYDERHTLAECMREFGFTDRAWRLALKRGAVRTKGASA
jgi:hypothetical protein